MVSTRKCTKLTKEDVSEHHLQVKLRNFRTNPRYIAENLHVFNWESDFLIKTRSGYWYEFECKISFSDFQHDFTKLEKHDLLKTGENCRYDCVCKTQDESQLKIYRYPGYRISKKGSWWYVYVRRYRMNDAPRPNYFAYCVPWYLREKIEPMIPEYAGFVILTETDKLEVVKEPPIIHKEKYSDEKLSLCEKFYYNWRSRIEQVEKNTPVNLIKKLRAEIDFLKAEYKAATGYDISEVF